MKGQRYFFAGIDPQQADSKKADDGAISIGVAIDRRDPARIDEWGVPQARDYEFGFIHHRVIRGFSASQWAAYIHGEHEAFGFSNIMLDGGAGGAGINVAKELRQRDQQIPTDIYRDTNRKLDIVRAATTKQVRPITARDDNSAIDSDQILTLAKRGDPAVDALWNDGRISWAGDEAFKAVIIEEMQKGLKDGMVALLPPFEEWPRESHADWDQERVQALRVAGAMADQLSQISVQVIRNPDGSMTYVTNSRGIRKFNLPTRKDIAFSGLYCYAAFLTWVKMLELGWVVEGREDGDVYFAS